MAVKAGWTDLGNGLVKGPDNYYGGTVDVNNPIYTNYQDPAGTPHVEAGGGVQASSTPPPITDIKQVQNTTANVGQTTPQGAPTTVAQSFQQALVNRLNPTPVGTSSPEVAPAIQANNLMEQRAMERNRALLAERAAAQGQDLSGGFETNLLGLAQDRAAREGQFAGNAVQQANVLQNQNATNALGVIGNLLTGNANRDLQQQLAEMANTTQLHGIDTQGNLGAQDIALRGRLGEGQLNLGLLAQLLGNQQFNSQLGQNASQFGASLDQQGLIDLFHIVFG